MSLRTGRMLLLVAGASAGLAALMYGPDVLNAWRFMRALDHQSDLVSSDRARELALSCRQCHGGNGISASELYPSLAGQPAGYIAAQLDAFASGRRKAPHMEPLARDLSPVERNLIDGYYAGLAAPAPQSTGAANSRASAQLDSCRACHGKQLRGASSPMIAPRLAGQARGYLIRQLDAFKTGARADPTGTMAAVARGLDPDQVHAIAEALTGL